MSKDRGTHDWRGVTVAIAAALAMALAFVAPGARVAKARTWDRPISDFIDAQGTTNIFIPPLPDFIGWANNNPQTRFASVDYAGVVADYLASHGGPLLGTQVTGTVADRPLADGRSEVTVVLRTTNALSWAIALPATDFATDPLLFGYRGTDLLANPALPTALSSSEMKVVFTNTAPLAPLPDLVVAFILGGAAPGQELVSLGFTSSGTGPLRAPFGVPDGTPGRLSVIQTGLFMTHFQGATADGFPAERVDLRQVGAGLAESGETAAGGEASSAAGSGMTSGSSIPRASAVTTWGRIKAIYRP